ncbi:hypothetical protein DAT35_20805 [Vitiosangium sp. GDMCC 1.1324]|nr:hypothetical protein DAT35_20805 [Vitiosangium sp. GDMCC 1.1324]
MGRSPVGIYALDGFQFLDDLTGDLIEILRFECLLLGIAQAIRLHDFVWIFDERVERLLQYTRTAPIEEIREEVEKRKLWKGS